MRRSISLLCGCLALGWVNPVAASEGPSRPPVQQESQSVAAPVVEPIEPKRPRHGPSEAMMTAGSIVLSVGAALTVVGGVSWVASSTSSSPLVPPAEVTMGLVFGTLGATFLAVGVKQHKRWKANLAEGRARVQWQPVIGLTQIGVMGRF